MVHHAVVVTIGVYFMYRFQTTGEIISAHGLALVSPFVFGYLIGDTLFYVVFEAMDGRYEYLIHHIVGIWLVGGALRAKSPEILSFVPHILITEISTFLFGAGWVLRSTSWKTYPIINQLELAFCLTFTLTRVINLPYQVWCAWPHMDEIGTAKYAFVGVLAIQFFWFYKIVKGVISKYIVKEKDSKEA
jgi:ethanolamine transporter EutH